ncbi:MAG: endolytic transglycosylase MltG [bacterium]|nr:endolytic transglycosylase MltG [bacterium]
MSYRMPQRRGLGIGELLSRFVKLIAASAVILLVFLVGFYVVNLKAVGGSSEDVTFVVDEGQTFPQIASMLEKTELIRNETVFNFHLRISSYGELKAGTYKLNKSMSVKDIAVTLTDGNVATDLVTILPGKRIDQVKSELIRAGFNEAEVETALNPSLYGSHQVFAGMTLPVNLEGFIYPESYIIAKGTTVEEIITLALNETAKAFTTEIKSGINKQGLTLYEGLTLASIIEREVSTKSFEDQQKVAQVFLKRYKEGIALQSDPTAVYGAVYDGVVNDDTTVGDMIAYDSPYNTYKYSGLPPTPISNISASTLKALVNPSNTNFLYFVSGSDCVTRFGANLQEHEAYISDYGVATADSRCQ